MNLNLRTGSNAWPLSSSLVSRSRSGVPRTARLAHKSTPPLASCSRGARGRVRSLQQYFHRVYRVRYQSMAALNVAIYDKSLVISNTARNETTVGLTVNLISVDVETIATLFTYLQNLASNGGSKQRPARPARPTRTDRRAPRAARAVQPANSTA